MIRLLLAGFLGLTLAALATADDPRSDDPEPPVRLKKKQRPAPKSDEKPGPKKDESPKKKEAEPKDLPEPGEPAEKEKEILERLGKNVRESTERLGRKDTGEGTRQTQSDVVKDLDALIQQTRRQQQQPQDQQPNAGASGKRNSKNQQAGGKSSRSRSERKSRPGKPRNSPDQSAQANQSNKAGAGKNSEEGPSKIAEMYKERWGELPETLRMEMDAYSRERFMARYSELLKQYYSTIAERGRRREGNR